MPNIDLRQTNVGDDRPSSLDYIPPIMNTDGVSSQKETRYFNTRWTEYFGQFMDNPHLKNAITLRATWDLGKGYTTDPATGIILDHITGWGKETFIDVLFNMDMTMCIGGDAYAQIIRDDVTDDIINLKPLNPASIVHVIDGKGIIKGYEQITRLGDSSSPIKELDVDEILHFSLDRMADNIHGTSLIPAMTKILNAWGENFTDRQLVMHRQAKPLIIFKLRTDNATVIEQFKQKMQDAMRKATDNMIFIPDDENMLSYDVLKIEPSALLFQQADSLRKDFYSVVGSAELLSDSSGSTESGGKIGSINNSQIVDKRQSYIEGQIWNQLQLKIELTPPDSLIENLKGDESKDAQNALTFQPNDMMAGVGK